MAIDFRRFGGTPIIEARVAAVIDDQTLKDALADPSADIPWNFGINLAQPQRMGMEVDLWGTFQNTLSDRMMAKMPLKEWDGKTPTYRMAMTKKIRHHGTPGAFLPAQFQPNGTCFPAGVMIAMADGSEKPIEAVKIGDVVISHTGAKRRVVNTFTRQYTGDLYTVNVAGYRFPLSMTDDHQMAIIPSKGGYRWKPGEIEWIPAKELSEGDRMLMPFGDKNSECRHLIDLADYIQEHRISEREKKGTEVLISPFIEETHVRAKGSKNRVKRHVTVDESFCRLVGLYLAEGSPRERGIVFTFGGHEEVLAREVELRVREIFGIDCHIRRPKSKNVIRVVCESVIIRDLFNDLCGGTCYTKRVHPMFQSSSQLCRMAMIRGWLDGDGHPKIRSGHGFSVRGVSSSPELIRGMYRLAISCELNPRALRRQRAKHQRVASLDLYLNGNDGLALYPERRDETLATNPRTWTSRTAKVEHGFAAKIEKIETHHVENLTVYDFEVEVDHSFIANCMASHNCVGRGASGALNVFQALLCLNGFPMEWRPISHAWCYAGARMQYNDLGRGDGAVGKGAFEWCGQRGMTYQVEAGDTDYYKDAVAVKWATTGIPSNIITLGKDNPVTDVFPVTTAKKACDVLWSGGAVTVASSRGFTSVRDADGFCRPSGTWNHQMHFVDIIIGANGRKGLACVQSWGEDAQSGPKIHEQPGYVFGVDMDVADAMLRVGDSMGAMSFEGWLDELSWGT